MQHERRSPFVRGNASDSGKAGADLDQKLAVDGELSRRGAG